MDTQTTGIITIAAIIVLIIAFIIAIEFQEVATAKGYTSSKYFWYTFLFGIFGCLLVIALPDQRHNRNTGRKQNYNSENDKDELPDL